MQRRGDGDVAQKIQYGKQLRPLMARGRSNVRERAVDEVAESSQAAAQHRSGIPVDADRAPLDHVERQDRCIDDVPNFVRDLPHSFEFVRRP